MTAQSTLLWFDGRQDLAQQMRNERRQLQARISSGNNCEQVEAEV